MEKRLLVFIFFLLLVTGLLTLVTYQKYFKQDQQPNLILVEKTQKEFNQSAHAGHVPEVSANAAEDNGVDFKLVLSTDSLKNGYRVYQEKGQCIKCHGAHGEGNTAELGPKIAGQFDWYIEEQVRLIKESKRSNPKMQELITNLSDQDIIDVSKFLSEIRLRQNVTIE